MFVSVTRTATGNLPVETATLVGEEMYRWLRDIDGFEGLLLVSRERTTLGLSFWESREVAERHRAARMEFLHRMLSVADAHVEEILDYEVSFAQLGALAIGLTK